MESLFIKLLNNSISATWLVLAVLLARLLLKKAPKNLRCALWGLVGLRLALPVRLQSVFSLVPSAVTVSENIMLDPTPAVNSGISALDKAVNPAMAAAFTPEPWASANPLQILIFAASVIWLAGLAVMLLYSAVSWLLLRHRVAESVPLRSNIRLCQKVDSPFVLGMIRPRIYLPLGMDEESRELVIAHEQAHIHRRDNLTKPLAFLLLAVYWFNPLMWLAYILLCRDMELACDERVLREKSGIRKAYASALLQCSVPRHPAAVCPVSSGVESLTMRYYGTPLTDFSLKLNEEVPLNLVILPAGQNVDVVWGSENPEVLEVTPDPDDPQKCTVACITEIPQGGVKIYAEAGGLRTECTVYMLP